MITYRKMAMAMRLRSLPSLRVASRLLACAAPVRGLATVRCVLLPAANARLPRAVSSASLCPPPFPSSLAVMARALSDGGAASAASVSEELSDMYSEGREAIEDAEESKGTVYFEEDLNEAKELIQALLARYEEARTELPAGEAEQLVQVVGLKMEELRSRLDIMLEELIHDDD